MSATCTAVLIVLRSTSLPGERWSGELTLPFRCKRDLVRLKVSRAPYVVEPAVFRETILADSSFEETDRLKAC